MWPLTGPPPADHINVRVLFYLVENRLRASHLPLSFCNHLYHADFLMQPIRISNVPWQKKKKNQLANTPSTHTMNKR